VQNLKNFSNSSYIKLKISCVLLITYTDLDVWLLSFHISLLNGREWLAAFQIALPWERKTHYALHRKPLWA